jgi:hypothetical protein
MKISNIAVLIGATALACGCEAKVGTRGNEASGPPSAEGKAEEGKIAFSAPGLDVRLSIPLDETTTRNEGKILYPGTRVTGMYIAAHPDSKTGSDGEVELRFATPDPPEKVAAWYRDPARAGDFTLRSDGRDGAASIMSGVEKKDGDGFRLRLEPKGAGTDGRLILRDRA